MSDDETRTVPYEVTNLRALMAANADTYHAQRRELDAVSESLAAVRRERDLWEAEARRMRDERNAERAEVERLRKLFDDAGQGEHNVLALVEHYQGVHLEQRETIADLESQLAALSSELDQAHQAGAALAVMVREGDGRVAQLGDEDRATIQEMLDSSRRRLADWEGWPTESMYARRVALLERLSYAPPRETSASIAAWQTETFGPATTTWERAYVSERKMHYAMHSAMNADHRITRPNLSRAIRAAEELAEMIEVLVQRDDDPAACLEVADVQIVLAGIAAAHGKEQADLVTEKMKTNRARTWNTTGDGHGQHVEDGGDQ